jgi:multisite-specific tRNA:(cytosine-C5)-methyltransferase
MDKRGRIWKDYDSVLNAKKESGDEGLERLSESMFPPKNDLPLDRAIRVYPHQQDTGAFFIAVLEKKSEIRAKPEEKSAAVPEVMKVEAADSNGTNVSLETTADGTVERVNGTDTADSEASAKRKRSVDEADITPMKRAKSEEPQNDGAVYQNGQLLPSDGAAPNGSTALPNFTPQTSQPSRKKNRDQPFEEPFKYLSSSTSELAQIREFYNLSPRFPDDRYLVRNAQGVAGKNIYYTNALTKTILQENEGKGLKFVHAGVKMFVKQDAPAPDVCPWRIQTDGLRLLEAWVGPERIVKLQKKETLRKLLIEMFPRFHGEEYKNLGEVGEQIMDMKMGCCVLIVEPSHHEDGLSERMVFPLWKSIHSLNLMLPKEERKAMLLRLFNDDTPLVNPSKGWVGQKKAGGRGTEDAKAEQPDVMDLLDKDVDEELQTKSEATRVRNSSSPEATNENHGGRNGSASEDDDDEAGGVQIS